MDDREWIDAGCPSMETALKALRTLTAERDALKAHRDMCSDKALELQTDNDRLRAENERLTLELRIAQPFHRDAIAERKNERAQLTELQAELERADREHITLMELANKKLAALRADNARWKNVYEAQVSRTIAAEKAVEEAKDPHMSTLDLWANQRGEKLKAELEDAQLQVAKYRMVCEPDGIYAQLAELREAAEDAVDKLEEFESHWRRDELDNYESSAWEEAQELRAVLAKVK